MFNTPACRRRPQAADAALIPVICVVDPQAADYQAWRELAERQEIELHCFAAATEALRHARIGRVDLWVVNTELSGASGCELCGMLKSLSPQTNVYLVADHYSEAAERSAWAARATMFDVKPSHVDRLAKWLAHWREKRTSDRPTVDCRSTAVQ